MGRKGAALRGFAGVVGRLWFHHTERVGGPLPEGPVLLVLNHSNGLLDPLLAVALLDRPPRFVAKAALWNVRALRPLLAFFGAIPVQRSQDAGATGAAKAEALATTFAAVFDTFRRGEVLGIFPEGISHAGHDLAPLKTGPARMLLGAPVRPALVPAGLVYGDRAVFRHSALLRLGEPIPTADLQGLDPAAVLALTERIRAALYPLTLHAADPDASRLAQELAWLLGEGPRPRADLAAFQTRTRLLQDWLAALGPDERRQIEEEVAEALSWLEGKGLRPDQVGHPYPLGESLRWAPKALGRALLAVACLPAGLLHWPAYRLVDFLSRRRDPDLDVLATGKLLAGAVLLPAWSAALGLLSWRVLGPAGLWAWAVAAPLAILSLPVLEAVREDLRALRGWFARSDPAAPALLQARERLLDSVPRLRENLRRPSGTG